MRTCEIEGCARAHYGLGYCKIHYQRNSRTGSPHGIRVSSGQYANQDPLARLLQWSTQQGECRIYTRGKPRASGHRRMGFRGKSTLVHRIAWTLEYGEIPQGLLVCHRCDTPSCINPRHLFLGTYADNNADRDRKGRGNPPKGSRHGSAKLAEYQVLEVLEAAAEGASNRLLANRYGVDITTISSIVARKSWRHVAWPEVVKA